MRKVLLLISAFLFSAVLVYSQEIPGQKTIELNRQRLTVEIYVQMYGFLSINRLGGMNIGGASLSEVKKWKAYQGFREISEPDFFEIVGYKEEAERCRKYYENLRLKAQNSFAGMAVSGITMIAGLALITLNNAKFFIVTGSVLSLVGTIGFSIAAVIFKTVSNARNWAPASLALVVAEDYNKCLRRKIISE